MSLGSVTRGCGKRVKGGIYATCPTSDNGAPLEWFLVDPPQVVDVDALGLSAVGVKLIEKDGVTHVFDIVGQEHYPNVADYLEEVRRYGVSRRLPKTLEFERLTPQSRLVLLHRRAHIENHRELYDALWDLAESHACPKSKPEHIDLGGDHRCQECCAGLWWEDVTGADLRDRESDQREVIRNMPAFSYTARQRPDGWSPDYATAIFGVFPLARLEVIRDPEGGTDEEALQKANRANLPVLLEDE